MNADSVPVVRPPHELNDDTVSGFEAELVAPMGTGGPGLIVDLGDTSFVSSSGLACLVKIGMRLDARGRKLALARPQRDVERSLKLLRLDAKLPLFPSVDAAAAYVVQPA
jgi:anti-anti-sigma factor